MASSTYHRERGGGAVRLAYDLARGLLARGHQVSVVAEDLYDDGEGMKVEDGVTVVRYRLPPARAVPVRRHVQHISAATRALRSLPAPPDAVHGHSLFQYVAALRVFSGKARRCYFIHSPYVDELRITWRAQGWVGALKRLLGLSSIRRLEIECLRGSDELTAASEYTRGLIASQYGDAEAERISIVPGWVDLERYRPISAAEVESARLRLGWRTDRPVIFVLRRLEARMGLDNLLRALAIVRDRGHRIVTYVGGSGSQLAHLERVREEHGLREEVIFMGFIPGELVPLAYAACDFSVIPTSQLEGFGIIALEALACGRPTLVTPIGALPEVLNNFEPRWVARGSTSDDIAELICAQLEGRLPSHQASSLRETIGQRYGLEAALDRFEKLLLC
jgi:glycosyltransferase involved in cell wall biosynthesis